MGVVITCICDFMNFCLCSERKTVRAINTKASPISTHLPCGKKIRFMVRVTVAADMVPHVNN